MRVVVVPPLLPPPLHHQHPNSWPMSCLAQPPVRGLSCGPLAPSDPWFFGSVSATLREQQQLNLPNHKNPAYIYA
ncbi:hypothetical protein PBY51_008733 [Eleginops maclovinus]|uniref:Uncharacterized protein n=1 Tax=Eleginops maclovinus TaxID=56733 RepID=A0AAN8AAR0_ELEMC|nr:hypothetical protein PBY51_008733 [Eleginops maclovinus]